MGKKVIFLDMDGVINVCKGDKEYIEANYHNRAWYSASPLAIQRVIDICKQTDAHVVLNATMGPDIIKDADIGIENFDSKRSLYHLEEGNIVNILRNSGIEVDGFAYDRFVSAGSKLLAGAKYLYEHKDIDDFLFIEDGLKYEFSDEQYEYRQKERDGIDNSNLLAIYDSITLEKIIDTEDNGLQFGLSDKDVETAVMKLKEKAVVKEDINMDMNASEILKKLGIADISQNNPHHIGSLYTHTNAVVDFITDKVSDNLTNDKETLMIAAICHDIGKPDVVKVNEKTGYDQFINHAALSASIFKEKATTIPELSSLSPEKIEYISELIRLHDTKYSKQGKCQSMLDSHPNGFAKDLILLQYADVMGQSEHQHEAKLQEVKQFASFIKEVGTPEQTEGLDKIIDLIDDKTRLMPGSHVKEYICNAYQNLASQDASKKDIEKFAQSLNNHELNMAYDVICDLVSHAEDLLDSYEHDNDLYYDESESPGGPFAKQIATLVVKLDKYEQFYHSIGYILEEREKAISSEHEVEGYTDMYSQPEDKTLLARTASGQNIYVSNETYEHMKAHPDVDIEHIKEAISKIGDYDGQFRIGAVDLGRTIGKDRCIESTEYDSCVERLVRKGRDGQTPVLFEEDGFEPADTSKITVGICRDDDGKDTLFTAFYGDLAPKEPWDKSLEKESMDALIESENFWDEHALVVTHDMIECYDKVPLFDGKTANVMALHCDNDGYYFEYRAQIKVDGQIYSMDYRSHESDYNSPEYHEFSKQGYEKNMISGLLDPEHPEYSEAHGEAEYDYAEKIQEMYQKFAESGAEQTYQESGIGDVKVRVDGVRVNENRSSSRSDVNETINRYREALNTQRSDSSACDKHMDFKTSDSVKEQAKHMKEARRNDIEKG